MIMHRRLVSFLLWSVCLGLVLPRVALAGDVKAPGELETQLARIFGARELEARQFGPSRWMEEGKAYTTVEPSAAVAEAKDIVRYDTETGTRSVLVSAASLVPSPGAKPLQIDNYEWSKDGARLLVFTNTKKVWRANTRGDYWLLDVKENKLHKLGARWPESTLMFAKLSPDARRVAYVHEHDLWVEDVGSDSVTRLTSDGSATIINGTSDWVNEEEFFLRDGFRWSPDGKEIAFWRFDTSGVGSFTLINDTDSLYPVVTTFPYPKVGTTNSEVKIGIVSASGGTPVWVPLPGDARNTYVPRMEWVAGTGELMLQQLNRRQNANDVWLADAKTGQARRLLHDEDAAWVDVVDAWRWLPGEHELLWISERDGWRHAWAVSHDGGALRLLTPGDFDLLNVAGVDEKKGSLYFTASPQDAVRRYLYRAPLDGKGAPERVTPADLAGSHTYTISPDGRYAIHTRSTIDSPPVIDLVRLPSHQTLRVLEDNKALAAAAAPLVTPPTEFFQVDIGGGVKLDGWMIKPKDFDPTRKYPLLMTVYGEPGGATVLDAWRGATQLFHRALANAGYIVASVDNRGTPAPKGRAWRKIVNGAIGVLATQDQTAAVKALLATRLYLDAERVASWGWSGGGSMTLNLLFRSPDVYKVGMAVAPVPDQTLYDTIYQERYMGLPQDNAEGYKAGSPIHFAEGLAGKLLIVHGSGDDNVHFQGTERLVNRLVALGKPFDFMTYPNRTHAIAEGEGTPLHVFSLLARYLTENLPAGPRPASTAELASPRLDALRKEIAAGGPAALERFWQRVTEEGTPLVEPVEGKGDERIVTFLWRGNDETRNVVLVGSPSDLGSEEGIEGARLSRLPGTDVWYKSRRLRADARFGYAFSVNDSLIPGTKATEAEEEARWAALERDPLNPRRAVEPLISLAELPEAPKQPWLAPHPDGPAGRVEERTFRSDRLGNERIVRIYTPPGYDPHGKPYDLLVVLDGRTYTSDIPTPTILNNLLAAGRIPPLVAVFLANPSPEARTLELSCHPPFAEFLTQELLPWVRRSFPITTDPARIAIAGSSLGGLAAACAALRHPEVFGNVLSLSGSFYWKPPGDTEPEWVARQLATGPKLPSRFYLEAGLMEDRPRPETPSLLASNRHLHTVLQAKGCAVDYREFNGGHSILNWRGSIADGIVALFGAVPK